MTETTKIRGLIVILVDVIKEIGGASLLVEGVDRVVHRGCGLGAAWPSFERSNPNQA